MHSLCIQNTGANYDIPYLKPTKGIDPNHIALTGLNLQLDTLSYNAQGVLRIGVRYLQLKEKCGLIVNRLSGGVYLDSVRMNMPALCLRTP